MNDLQQLVGLVLPAPISWWPLAKGWYLFAFFICVVLAFIIYTKRKNANLEYEKNSYRRESVQKMQALRIDQPEQMLVILQYAVSQAILRNDLSCEHAIEEESFLNNLNQGHHNLVFNTCDWALLYQFTYQPKAKSRYLENEFNALKEKCLLWIKEHDYEHHA